MASYTYNLTDNGDGAVAAYFGTASMAEFNSAQSNEFSTSFIYDYMEIDTVNLEWGDDETEAEDADKGTFSVGQLGESLGDLGTQYYTFPSVVGDLSNGTTDIFEWDYYSFARLLSYNYAGLGDDWYISIDDDEEGNPIELNSFMLKESYQILADSYNIISSPEVTLVKYYATGDPDMFVMYSPAINTYQNLGAADPEVSSTDEEDSYSYTYVDGELAGIRAKFASPSGSTSLSLMQAAISSSVDKIYNTSNISRFNFKKTRAEILNPREVSSIDTVEDFNRPYRGVINV